VYLEGDPVPLPALSPKATVGTAMANRIQMSADEQEWVFLPRISTPGPKQMLTRPQFFKFESDLEMLDTKIFLRRCSRVETAP
jgi:hypothetical protein